MKNPPSFQFYPQDFLSDLNVQSMTDEEIGLYCQLLCYCWIEDGLPIKGGSPLVDLWFEKHPILANCFIAKGGKYRNPRLDLERQKQISWREKSSKGGLHTAEKKKLPRGGAATGLPLGHQVDTTLPAFSLQSLPSNNKVELRNSTRVIEAWNSLNIRNLRAGESKIREKTITKIEATLKEYLPEIIIKAIENYGEIVKHPELYFFTYKWELLEFLQRGLRKFVDEAQPFENFKTKNSGYQVSQIGKSETKPDAEYWAEYFKKRDEFKAKGFSEEDLAEKLAQWTRDRNGK